MRKTSTFGILLLLLASMASAATLPAPYTTFSGGSVAVNIDATSPTDCYLNFFNATNTWIYPMTPNLAGCTATVNFTQFSGNYSGYFVINGSNVPPFPNTYWWMIDTPPAKVIGLIATGVTETSLHLSWNAGEADIVAYEVFRNGTNVINTSLTSIDDIGLVTGQTYSYAVRARDAIQTGAFSDIALGIPTDMTPPAAPTFNPANNSVVSNSAINVTITYAEVVSAKVMYGAVVIRDLGNNTVFNWPVTFPAEGRRYWEISAKDAVGNERRTPYTLTYDDGIDTIINLTVVDSPFWNDPTVISLKDLALGDGTDWWVIQYHMEFYRYNNVRLSFSDFVHATTGELMRVDADIQPYCYCNYDTMVRDWTGIGYVYYVKGFEDLLQTSMDGQCPSSGGEVEDAYMYCTIPVEGGARLGDWNYVETWYATEV